MLLCRSIPDIKYIETEYLFLFFLFFLFCLALNFLIYDQHNTSAYDKAATAKQQKPDESVKSENRAKALKSIRLKQLIIL